MVAIHESVCPKAFWASQFSVMTVTSVRKRFIPCEVVKEATLEVRTLGFLPVLGTSLDA